MNAYVPLIGSACSQLPALNPQPETPMERFDHLIIAKYVVLTMDAGERFGVVSCGLPDSLELIGQFWQPHLRAVQRFRADLANVRPLGEARDTVTFKDHHGAWKRGFVAALDYQGCDVYLEVWRAGAKYPSLCRASINDVLPYKWLLGVA